MEQTTNLTIGKRIAAHRKRLGLTQDQLAEQVGVSAQAVSKWENDLSCPDISTLPVLARIFGVTTDELLGLESREPVHQAEVIEDSQPEENHTFQVQVDAPKRQSLTIAAWLIAIGGMMLAGHLLHADVGLWSAVWIMALTVFGISSVLRRFNFPGTVAALSGLYFAAEELELIQLDLGWNVLLPCLIVLLGVSLLLDGLTGNKKNWGIHINAPGKGASRAQMVDGLLSYSQSFSESNYRVQTSEFRGGEISVSFGAHSFDFSGVEKVAPECRLRVSSSFGETRLIVPRHYRVEMNATSSFGDIDFAGRCDDTPEGTIYVSGSVSFGELTVEYI